MTQLLCFDMDGVIFEPKNFWLEVHRVFGTLGEGKRLTKKYLHSDYHTLVKEVVVKLWKGKDAKPYFDVVKKTKYCPGAKEVFKEIKKLKYTTAIISSGSIDLARRAQHDVGVDFIYANELVIKDNTVSGEFIWPIGAGTHTKVEIIKDLCKDLGIKPQEVIYVGDSDTDIEAFTFVGTAIAFNSSSQKLKKVATHIVEGRDLQKILPFL